MLHTPELRRARRALRRDEGMTLVEMLVGISTAMVVIMASYAAMAAVTNAQLRTEGRVDAASRGRSAMETITRDLRAQMCLPQKTGYTSVSVPAMVWASSDGVEFYASVAPPAKGVGTAPPTNPGDTAPPEKRRIEWVQLPGTQTLNSKDASALPIGNIVETVWRADQATPPYTFTKVYKTRIIARDVEHSRDANNNPLPLFQYFGFDIVDNVGRPSNTPYPFVASGATPSNPKGAPSVNSDNLGQIVLVSVQFSARPPKQKVTNATSGTASRQTPVVPFYNKISVRTADPSDPKVSPLCL